MQAASPQASVGSTASPTSLKSASPAAQYERLESNIGEGTYGKVHKARHTKTGKLVAIKKAKVSAMDNEIGGMSFTALREIKLMQAVRHPNVMGCTDVFTDGGAINLVMEFMDGDLRHVIEEKSMSFDEPHVKCLAHQIMDGLAALHGLWFAHRDLTPTNILLSYATGTAKIGDFGFARTIGHRQRPLTPMCTTLWYRAPELLFGAKYYGQKVDIWSTGCILAEMLLRKPLFPGRGEFDMLNKIFEKTGTPNDEVWPDVTALPTYVEFSRHAKVPMSMVLPGTSAFAQGLVDQLLSLDPKRRPAAHDALSHEFFTAWPEACKPHLLPFVRMANGA